MDGATLVSLLTGFGGVIVGGLITFATETRFRGKEEKDRVKQNFVIVTAELCRVLADSETMLKNFIKDLPLEPPEMLWPNCRATAFVATQPSDIPTEVLLSFNSNGHANFSMAQLILRRFNTNLAMLEHYNKLRKDMDKLVRTDAIAANTDRARININLTDNDVLIHLLSTENALRELIKFLITDIKCTRDLLLKANNIWKEYFSKRGEHFLLVPAELEFPNYLSDLGSFYLENMAPFQTTNP